MYEQNEEFPFKYYGIDGRSAADKCTALDMQNGIYLYSVPSQFKNALKSSLIEWRAAL